MYSGESGSRIIRGSDDPVTLLAELNTHGWQGPTLDLLTEDLWLYGWDVLRGLIRRRKLPGYQPHLTEESWIILRDSSEHRDAVTLDTLGQAIPKFLASLREGNYDPTRSSLGTYFIGRCAIEFRPIAERWQNQRIQTAHELSDVSWSTIPLPTALNPARHGYTRILLARALNTLNFTDRAVMVATLQGYAQTDIAEHMGLTPRAVEGILYRARRRLRSSSSGHALWSQLLDAADDFGNHDAYI